MAVLGSGIMGSRIACHFANIGLEVLLLDISPKELNDLEKKKGLELDSPVVKNRIVNDALKAALKSSPSPIYKQEFAQRISCGNFDDDLSKVSDCDWVLEAIIENLEIKKSLYEKLEEVRKPGSLITSNTSGIPMAMLSEGRSEDFNKNFAGTHFFNPPRYLQLLEIIPGPKTDPEIVDFLMSFGEKYLGKQTVLCKDTPAFIANRIGIYSILKIVEAMQEYGFSVEEVDRLTGPLIGRAKSATFRTSDLVGLDTLIKVADNLYKALPNDESRETFDLPQLVRTLQEKNWLGDKTKQGFYKKVKDKDGKSVILALNLESLEYEEKKKVSFKELEEVKQVSGLKKKMAFLLKSKGKVGGFMRMSFLPLFAYSSHRIPEISDHLFQIDQAVSAGFGWEMGPFETWDALGFKKGLELLKEANIEVAPWIHEMEKAGIESFYSVNEGQRQYYDIGSKAYTTIPGQQDFIILDNIRGSKKVWSNSGSTIHDLGDGVLNLEFHTKMNTLGSEVIQGIHKAIDMAEKEYEGLVIGNQGANFSAGANLGLVFMFAIEQEFDEIDFMVRQFQQTIMRVRYSNAPVIVAPHGLTLGGGCEMSLHADRIQAAAETYIGLVEVGVGVIPAGCGSKEMALRVSDSFEEGDPELNNLQNAFMNIATAKVATSAYEAFDMRVFQKGDGVSINKDRQIQDAKNQVLGLLEAGYVAPTKRKDIRVLGKQAIALFEAGINGMRMANYISDHDAKVARKLSFVMAGGDLSYPQLVDEDYLLNLERDAFVSLTGEKKTLERIQSVLKTGKPLRN